MSDMKFKIPKKEKKEKVNVNFLTTPEKKEAFVEKCKKLKISYTFLFNSFIDQFLDAEE